VSANHILVLTIFYDMSPSSKAMRFFHTWFATRSDCVGSYLRFGLFAVMLILLNFESSSLLIRFVTATTPGLNNLSLYKGSSVVLWWSCRVGDTCFLYQWRFIMKLHGRLYSGLMLYLKWRVGVFMCWACWACIQMQQQPAMTGSRTQGLMVSIPEPYHWAISLSPSIPSSRLYFVLYPPKLIPRRYRSTLISHILSRDLNSLRVLFPLMV